MVCSSTTDIQAGMGVEPCLSSYNNVASFGTNSYSKICKSCSKVNFIPVTANLFVD